MEYFSYLCNVKNLCGTIAASSYEGAIVVSNLIEYKVILYKDYCAVSRDRKLPSGFSQRALTARSAVFFV
nr:MAG TPA: hypothetical protein [Caudoviricetes sp.]